jgi:hypothetical protein
VGLHRNDDLTTIPAGKTVTVAPGVYGGVETPMALADGVVFVPVVNVPTDYTGSSSTQPDVSGGTGELYAIDVSTGHDPVDRQARRPGLWRRARGGGPRVHVDVHR